MGRFLIKRGLFQRLFRDYLTRRGHSGSLGGYLAARRHARGVVHILALVLTFLGISIWGISSLLQDAQEHRERVRAITSEAMSGARRALIEYAKTPPPARKLGALTGPYNRFIHHPNVVSASSYDDHLGFQYFALPCPDLFYTEPSAPSDLILHEQTLASALGLQVQNPEPNMDGVEDRPYRARDRFGGTAPRHVECAYTFANATPNNDRVGGGISSQGPRYRHDILGRLPWRTYNASTSGGEIFIRGLGDFRDGYGERLWYAVAPAAADLNRPINPHSLMRRRDGWLTVSTVERHQISDRAAAVLIGPGRPRGNAPRLSEDALSTLYGPDFFNALSGLVGSGFGTCTFSTGLCNMSDRASISDNFLAAYLDGENGRPQLLPSYRHGPTGGFEYFTSYGVSGSDANLTLSNNRDIVGQPWRDDVAFVDVDELAGPESDIVAHLTDPQNPDNIYSQVGGGNGRPGVVEGLRAFLRQYGYLPDPAPMILDEGALATGETLRAADKRRRVATDMPAAFVARVEVTLAGGGVSTLEVLLEGEALPEAYLIPTTEITYAMPQTDLPNNVAVGPPMSEAWTKMRYSFPTWQDYIHRVEVALGGEIDEHMLGHRTSSTIFGLNAQLTLGSGRYLVTVTQHLGPLMPAPLFPPYHTSPSDRNIYFSVVASNVAAHTFSVILSRPAQARIRAGGAQISNFLGAANTLLAQNLNAFNQNNAAVVLPAGTRVQAVVSTLQGMTFRLPPSSYFRAFIIQEQDITTALDSAGNPIFDRIVLFTLQRRSATPMRVIANQTLLARTGGVRTVVGTPPAAGTLNWPGNAPVGMPVVPGNVGFLPAGDGDHVGSTGRDPNYISWQTSNAGALVLPRDVAAVGRFLGGGDVGFRLPSGTNVTVYPMPVANGPLPSAIRLQFEAGNTRMHIPAGGRYLFPTGSTLGVGDVLETYFAPPQIFLPPGTRVTGFYDSAQALLPDGTSAGAAFAPDAGGAYEVVLLHGAIMNGAGADISMYIPENGDAQQFEARFSYHRRATDSVSIRFAPLGAAPGAPNLNLNGAGGVLGAFIQDSDIFYPSQGLLMRPRVFRLNPLDRIEFTSRTRAQLYGATRHVEVVGGAGRTLFQSYWREQNEYVLQAGVANPPAPTLEYVALPADPSQPYNSTLEATLAGLLTLAPDEDTMFFIPAVSTITIQQNVEQVDLTYHEGTTIAVIDVSVISTIGTTFVPTLTITQNLIPRNTLFATIYTTITVTAPRAVAFTNSWVPQTVSLPDYVVLPISTGIYEDGANGAVVDGFDPLFDDTGRLPVIQSPLTLPLRDPIGGVPSGTGTLNLERRGDFVRSFAARLDGAAVVYNSAGVARFTLPPGAIIDFSENTAYPAFGNRPLPRLPADINAKFEGPVYAMALNTITVSPPRAAVSRSTSSGLTVIATFYTSRFPTAVVNSVITVPAPAPITIETLYDGCVLTPAPSAGTRIITSTIVQFQPTLTTSLPLPLSHPPLRYEVIQYDNAVSIGSYTETLTVTDPLQSFQACVVRGTRSTITVGSGLGAVTVTLLEGPFTVALGGVATTFTVGSTIDLLQALLLTTAYPTFTMTTTLTALVSVVQQTIASHNLGPDPHITLTGNAGIGLTFSTNNTLHTVHFGYYRLTATLRNPTFAIVPTPPIDVESTFSHRGYTVFYTRSRSSLDFYNQSTFSATPSTVHTHVLVAGSPAATNTVNVGLTLTFRVPTSQDQGTGFANVTLTYLYGPFRSNSCTQGINNPFLAPSNPLRAVGAAPFTPACRSPLFSASNISADPYHLRIGGLLPFRFAQHPQTGLFNIPAALTVGYNSGTLFLDPSMQSLNVTHTGAVTAQQFTPIPAGLLPQFDMLPRLSQPPRPATISINLSDIAGVGTYPLDVQLAASSLMSTIQGDLYIRRSHAVFTLWLGEEYDDAVGGTVRPTHSRYLIDLYDFGDEEGTLAGHYIAENPALYAGRAGNGVQRTPFPITLQDFYAFITEVPSSGFTTITTKVTLYQTLTTHVTVTAELRSFGRRLETYDDIRYEVVETVSGGAPVVSSLRFTLFSTVQASRQGTEGIIIPPGAIIGFGGGEDIPFLFREAATVGADLNSSSLPYARFRNAWALVSPNIHANSAVRFISATPHTLGAGRHMSAIDLGGKFGRGGVHGSSFVFGPAIQPQDLIFFQSAPLAWDAEDSALESFNRRDQFVGGANANYYPRLDGRLIEDLPAAVAPPEPPPFLRQNYPMLYAVATECRALANEGRESRCGEPGAGLRFAIEDSPDGEPLRLENNFTVRMPYVSLAPLRKNESFSIDVYSNVGGATMSYSTITYVQSSPVTHSISGEMEGLFYLGLIGGPSVLAGESPTGSGGLDGESHELQIVVPANGARLYMHTAPINAAATAVGDRLQDLNYVDYAAGEIITLIHGGFFTDPLLAGAGARITAFSQQMNVAGGMTFHITVGEASKLRAAFVNTPEHRPLEPFAFSRNSRAQVDYALQASAATINSTTDANYHLGGHVAVRDIADSRMQFAIRSKALSVEVIPGGGGENTRQFAKGQARDVREVDTGGQGANAVISGEEFYIDPARTTLLMEPGYMWYGYVPQGGTHFRSKSWTHNDPWMPDSASRGPSLGYGHTAPAVGAAGVPYDFNGFALTMYYRQHRTPGALVRAQQLNDENNYHRSAVSLNLREKGYTARQRMGSRPYNFWDWGRARQFYYDPNWMDSTPHVVPGCGYQGLQLSGTSHYPTNRNVRNAFDCFIGGDANYPRGQAVGFLPGAGWRDGSKVSIVMNDPTADARGVNAKRISLLHYFRPAAYLKTQSRHRAVNLWGSGLTRPDYLFYGGNGGLHIGRARKNDFEMAMCAHSVGAMGDRGVYGAIYSFMNGNVTLNRTYYNIGLDHIGNTDPSLTVAGPTNPQVTLWEARFPRRAAPGYCYEVQGDRIETGQKRHIYHINSDLVRNYQEDSGLSINDIGSWVSSDYTNGALTPYLKAPLGGWTGGGTGYHTTQRWDSQSGWGIGYGWQHDFDCEVRVTDVYENCVSFSQAGALMGGVWEAFGHYSAENRVAATSPRALQYWHYNTGPKTLRLRAIPMAFDFAGGGLVTAAVNAAPTYQTVVFNSGTPADSGRYAAPRYGRREGRFYGNDVASPTTAAHNNPDFVYPLFPAFDETYPVNFYTVYGTVTAQLNGEQHILSIGYPTAGVGASVLRSGWRAVDYRAHAVTVNLNPASPADLNDPGDFDCGVAGTIADNVTELVHFPRRRMAEEFFVNKMIPAAAPISAGYDEWATKLMRPRDSVRGQAGIDLAPPAVARPQFGDDFSAAGHDTVHPQAFNSNAENVANTTPAAWHDSQASEYNDAPGGGRAGLDRSERVTRFSNIPVPVAPSLYAERMRGGEGLWPQVGAVLPMTNVFSTLHRNVDMPYAISDRTAVLTANAKREYEWAIPAHGASVSLVDGGYIERVGRDYQWTGRYTVFTPRYLSYDYLEIGTGQTLSPLFYRTRFQMPQSSRQVHRDSSKFGFDQAARKREMSEDYTVFRNQASNSYVRPEAFATLYSDFAILLDVGYDLRRHASTYTEERNMRRHRFNFADYTHPILDYTLRLEEKILRLESNLVIVPPFGVGGNDSGVSVYHALLAERSKLFKDYGVIPSGIASLHSELGVWYPFDDTPSSGGRGQGWPAIVNGVLALDGMKTEIFGTPTPGTFGNSSPNLENMYFIMPQPSATVTRRDGVVVTIHAGSMLFPFTGKVIPSSVFRNNAVLETPAGVVGGIDGGMGRYPTPQMNYENVMEYFDGGDWRPEPRLVTTTAPNSQPCLLVPEGYVSGMGRADRIGGVQFISRLNDKFAHQDLLSRQSHVDGTNPVFKIPEYVIADHEESLMNYHGGRNGPWLADAQGAEEIVRYNLGDRDFYGLAAYKGPPGLDNYTLSVFIDAPNPYHVQGYNWVAAHTEPGTAGNITNQWRLAHENYQSQFRRFVPLRDTHYIELPEKEEMRIQAYRDHPAPITHAEAMFAFPQGSRAVMMKVDAGHYLHTFPELAWRYPGATVEAVPGPGGALYSTVHASGFQILPDPTISDDFNPRGAYDYADISNLRLVHQMNSGAAMARAAWDRIPIHYNLWLRLPSGVSFYDETGELYSLAPGSILNPVRGTYTSGVDFSTRSSESVPVVYNSDVTNFAQTRAVRVAAPALVIPSGKEVIVKTGGEVRGVQGAVLFSFYPLANTECAYIDSAGVQQTVRINQALEGVEGSGQNSLETLSGYPLTTDHPCAWIDEAENNDGDRDYIFRSRDRVDNPPGQPTFGGGGGVIGNDRTYLIGGHLTLDDTFDI